MSSRRSRGLLGFFGGSDNQKKTPVRLPIISKKEATQEEAEVPKKKRNDQLYLLLVEPFPVEPPNYESTLPKISSTAYDTFEPLNEVLPPYVPTVYKMGILCKKMEWASPYEMAYHRQWKTCLVELNNTQLNFYDCTLKPDDPIISKLKIQSSFSNKNSDCLLHPYHHHHLQLKRQTTKTPQPTAFNEVETPHYLESYYRSIHTTKTDLKALKFFKSHHMMDSTNISRSYSLQYGKTGVAIDYKKKHYVLRLRLENEQFILEFPSSESMIEWHSAISLGIDNSLDLERRDMPKFRSVPRRRRRRQRKNDNFDQLLSSAGISIRPRSGSIENRLTRATSIENIFRRRSNSGPEKAGSFMGKFITLKGRRNTVSNYEGENIIDDNTTLTSNKSSRETLKKVNKLHSSADFESFEVPDHQIASSYDENIEEEEDVAEEEEEDDDEESVAVYVEDASDLSRVMEEDEHSLEETRVNAAVSVSPQSVQSSTITQPIIIETPNTSEEQMYISNSSLQPEMFDSINKPAFSLINQISTNGSFDVDSLPNDTADSVSLRSYTSYIAKLSHEEMTTGNKTNKKKGCFPEAHQSHSFRAQRKILRDSMRCIPPLPENERWINRWLVMDAIEGYFPQSKQMVDKYNQCSAILVHVPTAADGYVHHFQRKLQEWVVTPAGLIPRVNREE
ncbi:hypothetical protein DAMA08_009170 [Martiniozyma asiatica (nom. inval.)]|nr:hypothetical protein DAMA08_009170 [Martiniozyma asiatica]